MKVFLLMFGLFITLNLKSQNLKATFEWIKIAVESHSSSFLSLAPDSTKLIVVDEPSGNKILGVRQTMPLNKIRSANFEDKEDIVRLELKCTSDKCVHIELKAKNEPDFDPMYAHDVITLSIPFNRSIQSDMRKRILKAFNHLIQLSGGTVLDNTF